MRLTEMCSSNRREGCGKERLIYDWFAYDVHVYKFPRR
jgi:hypothetical protein